MKATRHNGRSGKHGTYDAKHNDRRFDVENSEHIDAERTKFNVYWDCYQGYSLPNDENERARFTFTEVERRAQALLPYSVSSLIPDLTRSLLPRF